MELEKVGRGDSCPERSRILGASVVRYSTGELTLEVNCISGLRRNLGMVTS